MKAPERIRLHIGVSDIVVRMVGGIAVCSIQTSIGWNAKTYATVVCLLKIFIHDWH